jgi:translation elongation factor EF-G
VYDRGEWGAYEIAGAGELHLEIFLKDLHETIIRGAEIIVSDAVVSFWETAREIILHSDEQVP